MFKRPRKIDEDLFLETLISIMQDNGLVSLDWDDPKFNKEVQEYFYDLSDNLYINGFKDGEASK